METSNLAKAITKAYLESEDWHETKLTEEEANRYHESAIKHGHIISVSDGDKLAGYIEFYINHMVCYVHNFFIYPEYRNGKVIRMIKKRLLERASPLKVLIGERYKDGVTRPKSHLRSNHVQG